MNIDFYSEAKVLDSCKKSKKPTRDQIDLVTSMIQDDKYYRYFFEGLDNPSWIIPLYHSGIFHKVPEPIEVEKNSFRIPSWLAGNYLVRFAEDNEGIIIDLARSIKTKNWRVQELLIDALIKIKPENAIDAIQNIDYWLESPFSQLLPEKIRKLADAFIDRGLINGAITLLGFVIKPRYSSISGDYSKYKSPLDFRSDHFWVSEYYDKQVGVLIKIAPKKVVELFSNHLEKAIELVKKEKEPDAEEYVGYYWRFDIPYRTFDSKDADVIDILIDGFRDALIEVCDKSKDDGKKLLEKYLASEHIIFKRVALYVLRLFGVNYQDLLNESFKKVDYLSRDEYVNEYQGLMRDQFQNIPKQAQNLVIETVMEGPKSSKYNEERREFWIQRNLEIIRDSLDKESLAFLENLTAKNGKADITERPRIVTSFFGGEPSPIPASELEKKTFDELKKTLIDFVPGNAYQESRRSLGEAFQIIVRENPQKYCDFASYLIDAEIRLVYSYFFINTISDLVKNKGFKLTTKILDLCEYIVQQEKEGNIKDNDKYGPGLLAAQLDVARLFENALRTDDPYLDTEMLLRIRASLIKLSMHPDPNNEEYGENSFDPFTRSLNCVRGQAMHGLIQFMLYVYRKDKKLNTTTYKEGIFDLEIQKVFDEKLDKDKDPSLAVHSVFGAYIPQMQLLSQEWLENNLEKIFPVDDKKSKYWDAAWDAYILTSNLFKNIFKLLLPQYKKAVLRLSSDKEKTNIGSSPDERLAQHLMLAYLNDLTGFGHENELLDLFFKRAPDNIRSSGIFWLYENLKAEGVKKEDPKWEKFLKIWNKRLKDAEVEEISKNIKEISCYIRWLPYCPVDYDDLIPLIKKSIKYLHDAFYAEQMIEYVAKHSEENPLMSIEILKEVVLLEKEPWWNPKDADEEKILRVAIDNGDPVSKRLAYDVINFRGEHGDFRWKKLLDV